ncbi:cytochrome c1 [Gluconobacter wancherniae]|uniref:cytochrome c1 n=1 Tax=Gluconobacter wancherniae TaxID=1307955 RepID=UPI001B8B7740|nr:cytochrome c1 [Gluconobacter wancherniae]MBS1088811.1 ubiquinol-cytochrome C reductase [Gluconobacter wancherniae]
MRWMLLALGLLGGGSAHASTSEQRGFKVFRQVCSTCHSLDHVAYADLSGLGLTQDQIKEYAAQHQVPDGLDEDGDPKTRVARPTDLIGSPYAGEAMARMANHGSVPPDFSRRAMTQKGGVAWIVRMLQSYAEAPAGRKLPPGSYYNTAMPHGHIGMPQPLHDGQISYEDGTPATTKQMAEDLGAFLEWTARPHLAARHLVGVFVLLYLAGMYVLLLLMKRRVWSRLRQTDASRNF